MCLELFRFKVSLKFLLRYKSKRRQLVESEKAIFDTKWLQWSQILDNQGSIFCFEARFPPKLPSLRLAAYLLNHYFRNPGGGSLVWNFATQFDITMTKGTSLGSLLWIWGDCFPFAGSWSWHQCKRLQVWVQWFQMWLNIDQKCYPKAFYNHILK